VIAKNIWKFEGERVKVNAKRMRLKVGSSKVEGDLTPVDWFRVKNVSSKILLNVTLILNDGCWGESI
jgi:hypothetical protein